MITIDPKAVLINYTCTLRESMKKLNQKGMGRLTLFVTNDEEKLIGSVTDGDIRRAFLAGFSIDSHVKDICNMSPIAVPDGIPNKKIAQLLKINKINSLPVLDNEGKIVKIIRSLDGDYSPEETNTPVIIMAGGEGKRLRPLTENVPKPMLKICGKPILLIIIETLKKVGFKRFLINLRYLGDVIRDYFKDGSEFDIEISYIQEPKPMGTAGSLGLIAKDERPTTPFLVVNGDLLSTLNFKSFRDFHISAKYDFTLCGRPYKVQVPFGYPVIEGDLVTDFREKPQFTYLVNSGIYCLSPALIDFVPVNEYFDMTDLIRAAINNGKRVGVFPLREEFHEIGRIESYNVAEEFYKAHFRQEEERL